MYHTHCALCLKEFFSRERLLQHLGNRALEKCGKWHIENIPAMSWDECEVLDAAEREGLRKLKKAGYFRTHAVRKLSLIHI